MQSHQLLSKGDVLHEKFFSGAKYGDDPAEQMSKAHKHQGIIAKSGPRKCASKVFDSAEVQSFGEAQPLWFAKTQYAMLRALWIAGIVCGSAGEFKSGQSRVSHRQQFGGPESDCRRDSPWAPRQVRP